MRLTLGIAIGLLLLPGRARAEDASPVPIPGFVHVFAPGPTSLGAAGLNVEPNTITDFRGTVALAYVTGQATDNLGHRYRMENDMRVMTGEYVAADGLRRTGNFGFI
jgi:hypothetical protein